MKRENGNVCHFISLIDIIVSEMGGEKQPEQNWKADWVGLAHRGIEWQMWHKISIVKVVLREEYPYPTLIRLGIGQKCAR